MTANEEIIWDMARAIQNAMRRRVLAGLTELPPWRKRQPPHPMSVNNTQCIRRGP